MEKTEALKELKVLLSKIEKLDRINYDLQSCKSNLENANRYDQSKLKSFDRDHKAEYIYEKIGKKPKKPNKKVILALPLYIMLLKKYKKDLLEYERLLPLAEAAYREEYAKEREKLAKLDEIEKEETIREAESAYKDILDKYEGVESEISSMDLLGTELKQSSVVKQLISYFENSRADTLKEAVNLWYDERRKDEEEARAETHRQEIKAFEKERVRAAKAAEDYAMLQYLNLINDADKSKD